MSSPPKELPQESRREDHGNKFQSEAHGLDRHSALGAKKGVVPGSPGYSRSALSHRYRNDIVALLTAAIANQINQPLDRLVLGKRLADPASKRMGSSATRRLSDEHPSVLRNENGSCSLTWALHPRRLAHDDPMHYRVSSDPMAAGADVTIDCGSRLPLLSKIYVGLVDVLRRKTHHRKSVGSRDPLSVVAIAHFISSFSSFVQGEITIPGDGL
jgi:hypothetical protein